MEQDRSKVVWFEGMALDPHHFQQWDRHQQGLVAGWGRSTTPYAWGFARLEVDRERLRNGEVALRQCRALLPDGLLIDLPAAGPLPSPRPVSDHFPAEARRLRVYLAVPAEEAARSSCRLQRDTDARRTRYVAETITVDDANTGSDARPVEVARVAAQLRFGSEPMEAFGALPVAEVERGPEGDLVLSPSFVPPCLKVRASTYLADLLRRLVERLTGKSEAFAERAAHVFAQRELTPPDLAVLGVLSTINRSLPRLLHYHRTGEVHPVRLYEALVTLAGGLSAYVPGSRVRGADLPAYDHEVPGPCFTALDEALRATVGRMAPRASYERLALVRQRENLYTARVDAGRARAGQLYLSVRGEQMGEQQMARELPGMLRIASPPTIDAVLRSYTRALAIEHTTRPPSGLPADARVSYFRLRQRGPFWEAIEEAGELAVFVPSELTEVGLQMYVVADVRPAA